MLEATAIYREGKLKEKSVYGVDGTERGRAATSAVQGTLVPETFAFARSSRPVVPLFDCETSRALYCRIDRARIPFPYPPRPVRLRGYGATSPPCVTARRVVHDPAYGPSLVPPGLIVPRTTAHRSVPPPVVRLFATTPLPSG
jgi:hypothetical protein